MAGSGWRGSCGPSATAASPRSRRRTIERFLRRPGSRGPSRTQRQLTPSGARQRLRVRVPRGHVRAAGQSGPRRRQAPRGLHQAARHVHRRTVLALARAAREGRHVNGGRRWASKEEDVQQELANAQDAALYTVAGFTGLRQGELRALRWKHVRFADRTLVVVAGISAGLDSTTKSGKWRAVPLAREAFVALDELSRREWFTGPDDFVFCGPAGDPSTTRRCDVATTRRGTRPDSRAAVPPPSAHVRDAGDPRPRSRDGPDAHGPLEDHDDRALPTRAAAE